MLAERLQELDVLAFTTSLRCPRPAGRTERDRTRGYDEKIIAGQGGGGQTARQERAEEREEKFGSETVTRDGQLEAGWKNEGGGWEAAQLEESKYNYTKTGCNTETESRRNRRVSLKLESCFETTRLPCRLQPRRRRRRRCR